MNKPKIDYTAPIVVKIYDHKTGKEKTVNVDLTQYVDNQVGELSTKTIKENNNE